jgi:hypothetical protein
VTSYLANLITRLTVSMETGPLSEGFIHFYTNISTFLGYFCLRIGCKLGGSFKLDIFSAVGRNVVKFSLEVESKMLNMVVKVSFRYSNLKGWK